MDNFTLRRITKFIEIFRKQSGQLPTLKDFENDGFTKESIELALKKNIIEQFYLKLSTGTVVKGYKVKQDP